MIICNQPSIASNTMKIHTQTNINRANQLINELKLQNNALNKDNAELRKENEDLKKLLTILHKQNAFDQQIQIHKLSSALYPEYADFCSTIDMQMSIDLGENFRLQLNNIFRILQNDFGITFMKT